MTTPSRQQKMDCSKLQKLLRRNVGNAIVDYQMIADGDRVMVCLSGGKDSHVLLDILMNLRNHAPINFEIVGVNMDQKQPGFPADVLPAYLDSLNIEYHIVEQDTYSVVRQKIPEGKTACGLCSRLRRGTLYAFAEKIGANKIALGHHQDDIVETLFLNMFFGSKLAAMPPKLLSDDKRNIVIRPLAYCREQDIENYASIRAFPIIPCDLCGSQPNLQRQKIKSMLTNWERSEPDRVASIFRALQNIALSQLADTNRFDFSGLQIDRSEEKAPYPFNEAGVSKSGNERPVQFIDTFGNANQISEN
ncbi:MAG: tRNA 2-thiocytidine(32) synthetase TtcA [Chromatiales bacterium]|jgi:tRNA 2-thiocytidine biosynthesis protein TtcA|nr:tRNA 2-thiocytidine(32) synthetase TtcA [Chromatiales bacterium]